MASSEQGGDDVGGQGASRGLELGLGGEPLVGDALVRLGQTVLGVLAGGSEDLGLFLEGTDARSLGRLDDRRVGGSEALFDLGGPLLGLRDEVLGGVTHALGRVLAIVQVLVQRAPEDQPQTDERDDEGQHQEERRAQLRDDVHRGFSTEGAALTPPRRGVPTHATSDGGASLEPAAPGRFARYREPVWISELDAHGIADCDGPRTLERQDVLPRPWFDALALLAVGAGAPVAVASRLGWGLARAEGDELTVERAGSARCMLTERQVHVTATLQPDPPLFGRLRNAVLRDPAQAAGLAKGTLSARIGWLFTPDHTIATVDRLGASLGDVALARTTEWVDPLLTELVQRIHCVDEGPLPLDAWLAAQLAPDPDTRDRAERVHEALSEHFGLDLRLVRTDRLDAVTGTSLRPLRWAGPDAARHARLVLATELFAPDVLLVPWAPDHREQAYLASRCEGDRAVLEQVLVAG